MLYLSGQRPEKHSVYYSGQKTRRNLPAILLILAALLAAAALPARAAWPDPYYLEYSVAGGQVTVTAAVTPYDSLPAAREAFFHWFQRGFQSGRAGHPPLLIEWQDSPAGQAGRKGYDTGRDEAEKYRQLPDRPHQARRTITLAPD